MFDQDRCLTSTDFDRYRCLPGFYVCEGSPAWARARRMECVRGWAGVCVCASARVSVCACVRVCAHAGRSPGGGSLAKLEKAWARVRPVEYTRGWAGVGVCVCVRVCVCVCACVCRACLGAGEADGVLGVGAVLEEVAQLQQPRP